MKNLTTKLITAITAAALLTCGIAACRPNLIQVPEPKKISDSESKETSEPSQPSDTWIEEPPTTVTDVTLGGWEIPEDPALTADLEQVFNNATEPLKSYFYEPVILLGTQLVSGTNYAFLCKSAPSVEELGGATNYVLVYVYEDLDGGCEITSTVDIDLGI